MPKVQASPVVQVSWPYFAFLIVMAVALYFFKWPILILAASSSSSCFFCIGWVKLAQRYPLTMMFVLGFLRGLFGRR